MTNTEIVTHNQNIVSAYSVINAAGVDTTAEEQMELALAVATNYQPAVDNEPSLTQQVLTAPSIMAMFTYRMLHPEKTDLVEIIKEIRSGWGVGLKEAKDCADDIEQHHMQPIRAYLAAKDSAGSGTPSLVHTGAAAVVECGADDCGAASRVIQTGMSYYWHNRLKVALHPVCHAQKTVHGENVSQHAITRKVA